MAEPGELLDQMLQDAFDTIEHLWGKNGLKLVADHMVSLNRAREHNRVIDELERLYGPLPSDPGAAMAEPLTVAADLDGGDARPNRRLDSSDRGQP